LAWRLVQVRELRGWEKCSEIDRLDRGETGRGERRRPAAGLSEYAPGDRDHEGGCGHQATS
jgi:hypothetical protein